MLGAQAPTGGFPILGGMRTTAITYPPELPVSQRRGDRRGDPRPPGRGRGGRDRLGEDDPAAQDLPGAGRGVPGMIGHTQPRRLAARTVAERVAEELGTELGGRSATRSGSPTRSASDTLVKLMTDGILLAEIQRDRSLRRYDTIIIDEAHERSLNIDFLLGYLAQLLPRRPDLKLIITSATIDPERFCRHFGGAPVVEVSGRTYPVEVRYRPLGRGRRRRPRPGPGDLDAVDELCREGPGDILVFLTGEREIRDTAEALRGHDLPAAQRVEVLPLYARLSAAEQHRVFQAHTGRRVVLATNVAETSLTVPGIRYVVDPGTARISRYSHRTKVQRLPIEPISQASANQRTGRCGRTSDGICIRLYAEDDFAGRPEFTEPEILRTNLASVILQMTSLRPGRHRRVPVRRPARPAQRQRRRRPARASWARSTRATAGAPDPGRPPAGPAAGRPAAGPDGAGGRPARLPARGAGDRRRPVHPGPAGAPGRTSRSAADELHAVRRPALRLPDLAQPVALPARAAGASCPPTSSAGCAGPSSSTTCGCASGRTCTASSARSPATLGIRRNPPTAEPDADRVHTALLAGLLSPHRAQDRATAASTSGRAAPGSRSSPGSALARKPPQWVMAAELVETSRLWAREVGPDRARVGRGAWPPTWSSAATPSRTGRGQRGAVDGHRAGHPVRRPARRRPAGQLRPGRPRGGPRAVPPPRPGRGRLGDPRTSSSPDNRRCWTRSRSWSTGPGAATSWSTTTPCSPSTTSASPPRSSRPGTSTPGGSGPAGPSPTC